MTRTVTVPSISKERAQGVGCNEPAHTKTTTVTTHSEPAGSSSAIGNCPASSWVDYFDLVPRRDAVCWSENGSVFFNPGDGPQWFSKEWIDSTDHPGLLHVAGDRLTITATNGTWQYRILGYRCSPDGTVQVVAIVEMDGAIRRVAPSL